MSDLVKGLPAMSDMVKGRLHETKQETPCTAAFSLWKTFLATARIWNFIAYAIRR